MTDSRDMLRLDRQTQTSNVRIENSATNPPSKQGPRRHDDKCQNIAIFTSTYRLNLKKNNYIKKLPIYHKYKRFIILSRLGCFYLCPFIYMGFWSRKQKQSRKF